jgi:hypothetical protein
MSHNHLAQRRVSYPTVAPRAGPRQRIIDYYAALAEQVEQKAEQVFAQSLINENHNSNELISGKRRQFAHEIKLVETANVRLFDASNPAEVKTEPVAATGDEELEDAKYFRPFCFMIDKDDYDFPALNHIDATFGYLIVIDRYVTKAQLACFRETLQFSHKKLNDPSLIFDLKIKVFSKFSLILI